MTGMQLKMAYNIVTLTILFESTKIDLFIFRIALPSSIDYWYECASGSNCIPIIISFELVVLIHQYKGVWSVIDNNHVPFKLKFDLVTLRLKNYSHVDILYFYMKLERHTLTSTVEKSSFWPLFWKISSARPLLSKWIFKIRILYHMGESCQYCPEDILFAAIFLFQFSLRSNSHWEKAIWNWPFLAVSGGKNWVLQKGGDPIRWNGRKYNRARHKDSAEYFNDHL